MKKKFIPVFILLVIVGSIGIGWLIKDFMDSQKTLATNKVSNDENSASADEEVLFDFDPEASGDESNEYSIPTSSDAGSDYGTGEEEQETVPQETAPQLQPRDIFHIVFDTQVSNFGFSTYQIKYISKVDNLVIYNITVNDGACVNYNKQVTLNRGQHITLKIGVHYLKDDVTNGCSRDDVYKTDISTNYGDMYFSYNY